MMKKRIVIPLSIVGGIIGIVLIAEIFQFFKGSGDEYVSVSSREEFVEQLEKHGNVFLEADLDFSDFKGGYPLVVKETPFEQTIINGGGHKITGINITTSQDNVGFFPSSQKIAVSDLSIENASVLVDGEFENVGILQGSGFGAFENVTVSGTIYASYSSNVGGFVGDFGGVARECKSFVNVNGNVSVGGLFGRTQTANVSSCENSGDVSGQAAVGGIIGWARFNDWYADTKETVEYSGLTNAGSIQSEGNNVGGIIGKSSTIHADKSGGEQLSLVDCANSGTITGKGTNTGGIVGNGDNIYSIKSCKNLQGSKVKGRDHVGGIAGKAFEFDSCQNFGSVSSSLPALEDGAMMAYLGGIAGKGTVFNHCENKGPVSAEQGGRRVGGIAGYATFPIGTTMADNVNSGSITSIVHSDGFVVVDVKSSQLNSVGGIFGNAHGEAPSSYYTQAKSVMKFFSNSSSISVTGQVAYYVGGIIGYADGGSFSGNRHEIYIENCDNAGDINQSKHLIDAGGILGYGLESAYVSNCKNTGDICGYQLIGGIAGEAAYLSGCENSGSISGFGESDKSTDDYDDSFGGVVGHTYNVVGCTNRGTVNCTASCVGGIVGRLELLPNTVCSGNKNYGTVGGSAKGVGGIAGKVYCKKASGTSDSTCTFSNNQNYGSVGGSYCGGLIGYQTSGKYLLYFNRLIITGNSNSGSVTGIYYSGGIIGYGAFVENNLFLSSANTNTGEVYGWETDEFTTIIEEMAGYVSHGG